jgi:hypothetical protein
MNTTGAATIIIAMIVAKMKRNTMLKPLLTYFYRLAIALLEVIGLEDG